MITIIIICDSIFMRNANRISRPRACAAHTGRSINAAEQINPSSWVCGLAERRTPLCASISKPKTQNGGPSYPSPVPGSAGPRRTGTPPNRERAPSQAPGPAPFGERFTRSGALPPRGPRQAAVPSRDNLIAFPRLRSITPRRRQNEALKGPAAPPGPAGRGP